MEVSIVWVIVAGVVGLVVGGLGAWLSQRPKPAPMAPPPRSEGRPARTGELVGARASSRSQGPASEDLGSIMNASQSVLETLEQRYRAAGADERDQEPEQVPAPRSRSRSRRRGPRRRGPRPSAPSE